MNKFWPCVLLLGILWVEGMTFGLMVPLAWNQAQNAERATAVTVGKVIAYIPSNHSTGEVEYWVSGKRYSGGKAGMNASDLGASIPVHYDPQNPSKAYVGNSKPSFAHNLIGIGIINVFLTSAVLWATFGKQHLKWKKTKAP